MGLSSLPTPKNDYEIVVPEDGDDAVEMQVYFHFFSVKIFNNPFHFKGTVSVISSDPPCKEGNVRFTTVP